ncbi:hypothetical protein [Streptomyces sp. NPDC000618]|uniref:hypothetical protein n=1 Tax=Streptomyces sp. NPDC000618 TaxID=3154265 RepID=UPI003317B3B8
MRLGGLDVDVDVGDHGLGEADAVQGEKRQGGPDGDGNADGDLAARLGVAYW